MNLHAQKLVCWPPDGQTYIHTYARAKRGATIADGMTCRLVAAELTRSRLLS